MEKRLVEKLPRILKNKKKLENKLKVQIESRGKEITVFGKPEDEYVAGKVIDALDFGFPFSVSLGIKERGQIFETINIKDHTRRKNFETIRARIIGKGGKTLKTLSALTDCSFELKDNKIGVVGNPEDIENAIGGLISIIKGSKQSNVYSYLEKHRPKEVFDLGLKEGFK